jgi:TusA-related sulfurtransferase
VLLKKFFNVGFEAIEVHDRQPFGLDDLARYPLFTPEFLDFMRRAVPPERHDSLVSSLVVTARRPAAAAATPARAAAPGLPEPDAVCDLGSSGCEDAALLKVRSVVGALAPGRVLEIRSTDPGLREDVPAWCRMTGHEYLGSSGPRYFVRKR